MKDKKVKITKPDDRKLNLDTIDRNSKKFVLGPLWHSEEKKRLYRPYYISR